MNFDPTKTNTETVMQALVDYAEELDLEGVDGDGLTYLKTLRDTSLAKITSGEASSFVSSTVNGQSFMSDLTISADMMFALVSRAIKEHRGELIRITYGVVIGIPH